MGDPMAQTQVAEAGATCDDSTTSPYNFNKVDDALLFGSEPTRLDRYLLLERIGQGSFATVWAAYDPKLDRRVAVKLLHHGEDEGTTLSEQLSNQLAEAQALAQLSHPNVVAVHDVQTFEIEGRDHRIAGVFIVMEFLAGASLREWMEQPHDWREVVAVFSDAGRGLAAAHDRGLVHRDFKPANVMFGADGRVRVLDFGLARTGAEIRRRSLDRSSESRARIVGTPAYMAPEQHLDAEVDPRSDQFGFCVALYEALYGQRPFLGDTRATLGKAKLRGEIQPPPRNAAVPARLQAIVMRGLAPEPESRFPSMSALLDALGRDPSIRRKRWAVGVAVAGLIASSGYGLAQVVDEPDQPPVCDSHERELAGVWDETVRREIHASFVATELPYAGEAFERVRAALDAHTAQWLQVSREICDAAVVRNELPLEVMAEQTLCLQRRLRRVAGLTTTLKQADAATVARAGDTVLALEPPETCRSAVAEKRREQPDEARRNELLEIEGEVARAGVLTQLGRYEEAITTAEQAIEHALSLSDPGSAGRAALARTRALWYLGRYDEAIEASEQAVRWAAIVGDDETEAMAQIRLIRIYTAMGKYDVAEAVAKLAAALVEDGRLGKDVEAWHDLYTAILYARQQRWKQAIAKLEHGLALREELYGSDHPELAAFHNSYGNTLLKQGNKLDEALLHYREALRLWETNFGPQYPDVASVQNNIGAIYLLRSDLDEARIHFEAALAGFELTIGADNPQLLSAIVNLGIIAQSQGRWHDALARYEHARGIAGSKFGDDNVRTANIDADIARVFLNLGEHEQAEPLLARALEIQLREAPDGIDEIVLMSELLAACQREQGQLEAWQATLERELELLGVDRELEYKLTSRPTYIEAQLLHHRGESEAALELAERHLAELTAAVEPNDPILAEHLALVIELLLDARAYEDAASRARAMLQSTKMDPQDRGRWQLEYLLGRAEAARGEREAAIAAFERALERSSGDDGNPHRAALVARELAPLLRAADPERAAQLLALAEGSVAE